PKLCGLNAAHKFVAPRRAAADSLSKLNSIRKFQTAALRSDAWNDTRHAGKKCTPDAKYQYNGGLAGWSIGGRTERLRSLLGLGGALFGGFGHDFFDFVGGAGELAAEQFVTRFGDQHVVFDAHAEILLGDVNSRFDGHHLARHQRFAGIAGIVDVQSDIVAQAVDEIPAERLAILIFSVRIDVIVGNFIKALLALAAHVRAGLQRGECSVLRAEDDVVNFA